jgi:hypothetical protein
MQLRVLDVFDRRYPGRKAFVYLQDGVTYYTKTHLLFFWSPPALPPDPL